MNSQNAEVYRSHVRRKIQALMPIFANAAIGDFSNNIEVPDEEDEFTELYVGVQVMIEVIREQLAQREKQLAQEMTTRRQLAFEKARDEALLESIGEGIVVTGPDDKIILMNYSAEVMLGLKRDEAQMWDWYEALFPTDVRNQRIPRADCIIAMALALGRKVEGKMRYRRKNGTSFPVAVTASPVKMEGVILGSISVFRDITVEEEQLEFEKRVKEQLARDKALDEALLEGIGEGILATDQSGAVVMMNKAGEQILHRSSAEVINSPWQELLEVLDLRDRPIPMENRPISLALSTKKKISYKLQYIRPDRAKVPLMIIAAPIILNEKTVGVVAVFRDITREEAIDRAKSEFVSLASHQLRTPLTSIGWYVERLVSGAIGKVSAEQLEYLQEVYRSNRRMIDLVNALLNVSRIELGTFAIEPKPTDLAKVAENVLKDLEVQIREKKLTLTKRYGKDLPPVNVDDKLIFIVLQNIISNAVTYTPDEGQVSLMIDAADDDLLITVSDTGIGIPYRQQEKIFTKLFRTDTAQIYNTGGTGLGLYIVKAIIDRSGGKIWFESKESKGTTFYVTIPRSGMRKIEGTKVLAP